MHSSIDPTSESTSEILVNARGLTKQYGKTVVLDHIDLQIAKGKIVGLIGPNGAGKTTALKALLGLTSFQGDVSVLGMDPVKQRTQLLGHVCFIADTAILPRWLKVSQALEYVDSVHPRFDLSRAKEQLASTTIGLNQRISQLSKGMVTQLHLALVMSIDAKILVLDEPTLGLDILYRKQFYSSLLNDYFNKDRTIIITTHQVEEIEALLTDLIFIHDGKLVLNSDMESLESTFFEIETTTENADIARTLQPISERSILGGSVFIYENIAKEKLVELGPIRTPSVADLFVAKMQPSQGASHE
ncbi:MAG: ABC transporter ATP-binding protein [Oceanicoccus sp.]